MYCKHCGSQIADDAIFCSHCGTRLVEETVAAPAAAEPAAPAAAAIPAAVVSEISEIVKPAAPAAKPEPEAPRKPCLEEMSWDVSEYPDSNVVEKTEDINFDWNADPKDIPDQPKAVYEPVPEPAAEPVPVPEPAAEPIQVPHLKTSNEPEPIRVAEIFDRVVPPEVAAEPVITPEKEAQVEAQVGKIAEFNTFNRKNQEFQQLLDREYEKVRGAGTIATEQEKADAAAARKFESRQDEMNMDEFLQQEGVAQRYEPKQFESDVLARIEAQEKQRAQQRAEEAARLKALEEARAEAAARKKAEQDRINAQIEADAAAAEEIRLGEEAELRRMEELAAKKKAAEEAQRLEMLARKKAEEEARALEEQQRREAEEARRRAEAEARAKAEAEAAARAEAERRRREEEAARLKAEAELKAAQEAARIRAQQEAAKAAREEAALKAAQEQRRREEEIAKIRREAEQKQRERLQRASNMEDEVRKALAQTARMREEEEAKIKEALAGIRGGRFSRSLTPAGQEAEVKEPAVPAAPAAPAVPEPAEVKTPETNVADLLKAVDEGPVKTDLEADKVEEAHRKTLSQIADMAKAREDFFADFPDNDKPLGSDDEGFGQTRTVDKEQVLEGLDTTKKISKEALQDAVHVEDAPAAEPEYAPQADAVQPGMQTVEEIDDLLSQFESVAAEPEAENTGIADLDAFLTEEPTVYVPADGAPVADAPAEEAGMEFVPQQEGVPVIEEIPAVPAEEPAQDAPAEDAPIADAPAAGDPISEALAEDKPGLQDTMVMPQLNKKEGDPSSLDFDSYGEAEAEALRRQQEEEAAAKQEAPEEEADKALSPKEQKKREKQRAKDAKRQAKANKKQAKEEITQDTFGADDVYDTEEERKGGKGRVILMIILILLCIIFAIELAGIGIKMIAPTSGAAEFIDNILNSLIHLITG